MTTQPEALRLATALEKFWAGEPGYDRERQAAAELRRLNEAYECNTAIMHARTKRMNELLAQRDALLAALKGITPPMPPVDAPCHVGLVPQEKCAHCGRIARARAAIKAVEGETK